MGDPAGTNPTVNAGPSIEDFDIENLACPELVEGVERFSRKPLACRKEVCKTKTDILTTYYISTISRSAATTDHQIDKLVYELYGLTDDEIAIVEGTD